ncbi:hypothetical protein C5167_019584 [Papaver somniferum]|uniref:Uncharacterized protein n=1 Tax=Papaver somniferum TaxID=3469 RepID=A0A4Y7IUJ8_PAPSO|nr:hypothetical protein C5167_019584 [Papaver somniferum]
MAARKTVCLITVAGIGLP